HGSELIEPSGDRQLLERHGQPSSGDQGERSKVSQTLQCVPHARAMLPSSDLGLGDHVRRSDLWGSSPGGARPPSHRRPAPCMPHSTEGISVSPKALDCLAAGAYTPPPPF